MLTNITIRAITAIWLTSWLPLSASLIAHFSLDESSGSAAKDSVNGLTASNTGGRISWEKGLIGGAATFSGYAKAGQNLLIPSIPAMNGASALTLSCWINPDAGNYDYEGVLMTRDLTDSNGSTSNWGLAFDTHAQGAADGRVSGMATRSTPKTLPVNKWSHVVLVWNGKQKTRQLYVDGVPYPAEPTKTETPNVIVSSGKWYIGHEPSNVNRHFKGQIDDVAIWNSPLNSTQVALIHRAGLTGKNARQAHLIYKQKTWETDGISLIVDAPESKNYDTKTMAQIAADIAKVINTCRTVIGVKPELHDPHNDKIRVHFSFAAFEPEGELGKLGMKLPQQMMGEIYANYRKGKRELPLLLLQMATRNCWNEELNYRIAYRPVKGDKSYDWWMKATARVIGVMCLSSEGLAIKGASIEEIKSWDEIQTTYQSNTRATWFNHYNNTDKLLATGSTLDVLLASFLFQVCQENGGKEFLGKWFAELKKLEALKSYRHRAGARNNVAIAASLAAKKDLSEFFNNEMKWNCSASKIAKALQK